MIEVVAIDGQVTKYDAEGSAYVVEDGHLWISADEDDWIRPRNVAVHASGTWAIARKVTA